MFRYIHPEHLGASDDEVPATDQEIAFIEDKRLLGSLDSVREIMNIAFYDYIDWIIKDPTKLDKRLKRNIRKNKKAIIFIHDTPYQVSQALPKVIESLLKRKATFLRLMRVENKCTEWSLSDSGSDLPKPVLGIF